MIGGRTSIIGGWKSIIGWTDSQYSGDWQSIQGGQKVSTGGRMIITMMAQIVPTYFDVWQFFSFYTIFKTFSSQLSLKVYTISLKIFYYQCHILPLLKICCKWEYISLYTMVPQIFHCAPVLFLLLGVMSMPTSFSFAPPIFSWLG